MDNDIMLTCQSVSFIDGYPVLRKVFRHLARTPRVYRLWVETNQPRLVRFLFLYSNGEVDEHGVYQLRADGTDVIEFEAPSGFEGGVQTVMLDAVTRAERASREVHFGGMTWLNT